MRIAFVISSLAVFLPASIQAAPAKTVKKYECRTIKEEPNDPTPIVSFVLERMPDRSYQAKLTPDADKIPAKTIAQNLTCMFVKVSECRQFLAVGGCKGVGPNDRKWGQLAYLFPIFSCENSKSQPPETLEATIKPFLGFDINKKLATNGMDLEIVGYSNVEGVFFQTFSSVPYICEDVID